MEKNVLKNEFYEDDILVDSAARYSLLWEKKSRSTENALSEEDDKARKDKADKAWKDKAGMDARKSFMCDEFWEDFSLMAKVCLLRNAEADLFDVFETIRTKFLGGWGYTESYLAKIDAEIEKEFAKA